MLSSIFDGIFDGGLTPVIGIKEFLLCVGTSLILGVIMAFAYMFKTKYTKSFVVTIALLPAIVCVVIMMVNGNIGAGVAVAGAFSLVRFRSAPGTAREIVTIFLAMGAGLIIGMGYLAYAALFTIILCLILVLLNVINFGKKKNDLLYKTIKITIPEDLDYTVIFEDLFLEYTKENELVRVKTTNLGSMFKLTYNVVLKDAKQEKEFIDKIRTRNGNLEIMVSRQESVTQEL